MNRQVRGAEHRQAYYAEAATWAADTHGSLRQSRKVAWIVAGAAGAIALMEAIAIVVMMPLKTVEPYTIVVDRQTGYVQSAAGLKPGRLSQDQAVTQSFLVQYVIARETFDATDLRANYRKVQLWSAGEAHDQYLREMAPANPQSPVKLYPPSTVVQTTIKSVSLISPTSALVRFDSERRDGGASTGTVRPYSAVIAFRYTGAPMRAEDRFVNPLGFQVTRYRRDAETAGALPSTLSEVR
jgi:type IV secretion system protein VirB8